MANPNWVKGVSGNPFGRPKKGNTFTEALEKVLKEKEVNFKGRKISGKEAAARKLMELAVNGDVAALKYIFDRIDGRPFESVELFHEGKIDRGVDLSTLTNNELKQLQALREKLDAGGDKTKKN